jgi:hypothetical protein
LVPIDTTKAVRLTRLMVAQPRESARPAGFRWIALSKLG